MEFKKIAFYFIFLLRGSLGIQTMPLQAAWHCCHKMQLKFVSMETATVILCFWVSQDGSGCLALWSNVEATSAMPRVPFGVHSPLNRGRGRAGKRVTPALWQSLRQSHRYCTEGISFICLGLQGKQTEQPGDSVDLGTWGLVLLSWFLS